MEDQNNNITEENSRADSNPPVATPVIAPVDDLPIKANFNRYDSAFTRLIVPLFMTRYIWPAIDAINPFDFLGRKSQSAVQTPHTWQARESGFLKSISRNFTALATGTTFFGMLVLYSTNTLHDIHSLYAEAVGYELGKNKEDVTYKDVFINSRNPAVETTCTAYIKRTIARLTAVGTFFVPWHKFRGIQSLEPRYEANANAGIGAVGAYLLGESFFRDKSFFDAEQNLASTTMNHVGNISYETIHPQTIDMLFALHHRNRDKNYQLPQVGSEAGKNDQVLTSRVAELMNQTYGNTTNTEQANFTIGKFNYLIGFGLLDKFPESLAFVELANKSSNMTEVKTAAAEIKNGKPAQEVFGQFGIDTNSLLKPKEVGIPDIDVAEHKFANNVRQTVKETRLTPKTHFDFAAQPTEQHIAI